MKITDYTQEQIEEAVSGASSIKEFVMALGLVPNNGQYRRAKCIASHFNIILPKYDYSKATKMPHLL